MGASFMKAQEWLMALRACQAAQCPMIRQGRSLFMLEPGQSIGDGADVWDVRGVTVDAFSEDE